MNPYESPRADSKEPSGRPEHVSGFTAVLIFSIVSFELFFILILTFFGNSSAYWPGYVCGGISVFLGLAAAYLALKTKMVEQIGGASLISAASSSLLIIVILVLLKSPTQLENALLPDSLEYIVPRISFSLIGAAAGLWGLVRGIENRRVPGIVLGGGLGVLCLVYLLAMGIHLASA